MLVFDTWGIALKHSIHLLQGTQSILGSAMTSLLSSHSLSSVSLLSRGAWSPQSLAGFFLPMEPLQFLTQQASS